MCVCVDVCVLVDDMQDCMLVTEYVCVCMLHW